MIEKNCKKFEFYQTKLQKLFNFRRKNSAKLSKKMNDHFRHKTKNFLLKPFRRISLRSFVNRSKESSYCRLRSTTKPTQFLSTAMDHENNSCSASCFLLITTSPQIEAQGHKSSAGFKNALSTCCQ